MYYFNYKHVVKKNSHYNQLIPIVELLNFKVNNVHVCT